MYGNKMLLYLRGADSFGTVQQADAKRQRRQVTHSHCFSPFRPMGGAEAGLVGEVSMRNPWLRALPLARPLSVSRESP